jgi:F-type H+-transporting ATPase subunit b
MIDFISLASQLDDIQNMAMETARAFGLKKELFFSQLLNIIIVSFLLNQFAYKPIMKVLQQRRDRIAGSLNKEKEIEAELKRTAEDRHATLAEANQQANKMIEEARSSAARIAEQETQKAAASAEQIISQAREAALAEREQMLAEFRKEVGHLVGLTTEKVIGRTLTDDDHKRLVKECAAEIAS